MKLDNVGIIGIGSHVPNIVVKNEDIENSVKETNSEWTFKNLGIKERRNLENDELPSDIAYIAANNAINDSSISKDEIDLVIVATSSPDRISPSTASLTTKKIGIKVPAFDVNAVCGGFVYALQMASSLIAISQYKNILVIGVDAYSRITNWNHRNCVFFGDGAGAVIVSKVNNSWIDTDIYGDSFGTDTAPNDSFTCHIGEKYVMHAPGVYEFATKVLPDAIAKMMEKHSITDKDIKWMIPHQPGHRVLFKTSEILNFPTEKVIFNMKNYANTAAASIPMALDRVYKENKLENGDIIIMPAVGSGWVWGVTLLKYHR